jgi:hypothetical protein
MVHRNGGLVPEEDFKRVVRGAPLFSSLFSTPPDHFSEQF